MTVPASPADLAGAPAETISIPAEPAAPATAARSFSADDIAKARQEEKDKLYNRINDWETKGKTWENQIAELTADREKAVKKAAEDAAKSAREAAEKQWNESDAKSLLAQAEKTWESKFEEMGNALALKDAVLAKEQAMHALSSYINSKVNAAVQNNEIAPELADFVRGNNEDEVNASLEFVKSKSAEIATAVGAAVSQQQPPAAPPVPMGVSTAGYTPMGPTETAGGSRTLTNEDIKNMSIDEYAKLRAHLVPGAVKQDRQGLFS